MCSDLERHGVQDAEMSAREGAVQFGAARHDSQAAVRQWPLQLERLAGRRGHPEVDLLPRRENHGHRFRMVRANQLVRLGRQERKDVIRRLALLHFPDRGPARPDAGKEGQRPRLVEGEPNCRRGAVRQHLVLGKTRPGHHALVLDPDPAPSGDAYTFSELERTFSNAGIARSEIHSFPPSIEQLVISHK